MKHTQGKWTKNYWTVGRIEIVTDNNVICEIHQQHEREEQVANARLIASAPELLGALKEMVKCHQSDKPKCNCAEIRFAKQAITKAENDK